MGSFAMPVLCFGLDTNAISIASAHLAVNETGKVYGLSGSSGVETPETEIVACKRRQRKGEGESFGKKDGREDAKEELCDEGGNPSVYLSSCR